MDGKGGSHGPGMKRALATLPRNLIRCFSPKLLGWHLAAILLTLALVSSGLDWQYFRWTRSAVLRRWMFPAVGLGALLPVVLPVILLAMGAAFRRRQTSLAGWAIAQAEIIGAAVAAGYKAITGRAHPMHGLSTDLTHIFRFGLLRGGVFWGWPSSHTTIAFAMAVTVFTLTPKQRWLGCAAIAYALYIGLGVSMTIHWFSDFVAGAIFGSVVGAVVGKSFLAQPIPIPNTPGVPPGA